MCSTQNSWFEFLNLEDASEAEKEILRNMLGKNGDGFKNNGHYLLESLGPAALAALSLIGSDESQNTDSDGDAGQPDFEQDTNQQNTSHPYEVSHMQALIPLDQNGPQVPVSSQAQQNVLLEHHQMSQGPPQQIPSYYPTGQLVHSGPQHPIHVPISVYHQQMAHRHQLLQASAGSFMTHHLNQHPHLGQQYPLGLQQIPYGHHVQPHLQQQAHFVDESGNLQKAHEHTPSSPGGQGGKVYRKPARQPRRNDEQIPQMNQYAPPFYPGVGYGTVYYNPGLAQTVTNVTGQPLILPSAGQPPPGGMYPPYQTHIYSANPGGDLEHQHGGSLLHATTLAQMAPIPDMIPIQPHPHAPVLTTMTIGSKIVQEFVPAAAAAAMANANGPSVPVTLSSTASQPSPDPQQSPPEEVPSPQEPTNAHYPIPEPQPVSGPAEQAPPESKPVPVQAPPEVVPEPEKVAGKSNGPSTTPTTPPPKEANPEYPDLGLPVSNGPGPGTSQAPARGRSWASIASSKQAGGASTNGPTNGILPSENTNSVSVRPPSDHVPMSEFKSIPQSYYGADPSFDTSYLSNENDPVALDLGDWLSKYELNHHSLSLTPRGLSNQSNFCYINATLQSLLACPPFVNLFRSMEEVIGDTPCRATPIIQSVYDFVMEFEPITRQSSRNKKVSDNSTFYIGANFEPTGIRKVLGLFDGATFKVEGRQEDAEEFLSHLLNGLHDEMIKVIRWSENKKDRMYSKAPAVVKAPAATNGETVEGFGEEDDEWTVMGPKGKGSMTRKTDFSKSPMSEMFVGQMSSLLNRSNTPKTTTLQPFFTLQLDIQDENIHSVRDALEGLSTKEEVTYSSSVNGQEMAIWKQLSLEVLPIILVLHMKRFVYDKSGNKIYKLDKKVDFSVDLEIGKDLLSINSKSKYAYNKARFYKLFAAVYHDGEDAHKGHYVADTFHPSGGSLWGQFGWIRYDDTAVKGIQDIQILNPVPPRVPYLLYYRRVDTLSQGKKDGNRDRDRNFSDNRQ